MATTKTALAKVSPTPNFRSTPKPPAPKPSPARSAFMDRVRASSPAARPAAPQKRSLVATERAAGDSVGAILSKQTSPAVASAIAGLVDSSEIGQKFKDMTGVLRASDGAFLLGLVARATGADAGMPTLRKANSAFMSQQINNLARGVGEAASALTKKYLAQKADEERSEEKAASSSTAITTSAPAAKVSGANGASAPAKPAAKSTPGTTVDA